MFLPVILSEKKADYLLQLDLTLGHFMWQKKKFCDVHFYYSAAWAEQLLHWRCDISVRVRDNPHREVMIRLDVEA